MQQLEKKPISQSNLLLRFYVHDGWTKEELDKCAIKGESQIHTESDPQPYYIFHIGNVYDSTKLLEIGYVERKLLEHVAPERLKLTDKQILDFMNWQIKKS